MSLDSIKARSFLFSYFSVFITIVLIVTASFVFFVAVHAGENATPKDKSTIFSIEKGDGLKEIANKLKGEGLISSTGIFKIYSLITGAAHRFKPGVYQFQPNASLTKIIFSLANGPQPMSVFILEGSTLRDIDNKLSDLSIIKQGELVNFSITQLPYLKSRYDFLRGLDSLEGFYFPDTYKFIPGAGVETVAEAMLDNFRAKAIPLLSGRKDWYRIVILASLLEKEVPSTKDRILVANILNKRIKIGMPLQVDSAITYIKCKGEYLTCSNRHLSKADFKVKSPYNTYLNKGLPPTPIASPGIIAIQAALNPKGTSFLFYLSDPLTQRTIFARTFEEHSDNRFKYLNL